MKNYVSLLPVDYIEKRKKQKKLIKIKKNLIVVVLASFILSCCVVSATVYLQTDLMKLQKENSNIKEQITTMQVYEQILREMESIEVKVNQITKSDSNMISQIAKISEVLPKGVWIIQYKYESNDCSILFGGATYEDVARTINVLQEDIATSAICESTRLNDEGIEFYLKIIPKEGEK